MFRQARQETRLQGQPFRVGAKSFGVTVKRVRPKPHACRLTLRGAAGYPLPASFRSSRCASEYSMKSFRSVASDCLKQLAAASRSPASNFIIPR